MTEGATIGEDMFIDLPEKVFVFPLLNSVVFPGMRQPIQISTPWMVEAIERAQAHGEFLGFLLADIDEQPLKMPLPDQLARVGTLGKIVKVNATTDEGVDLVVQSLTRFEVVKWLRSERLIAEVRYFETELNEPMDEPDDAVHALWRNVQRTIGRIIELNPSLPRDLMNGILAIDSPGRLADMVAAHFPMSLASKQELLEIIDVRERLEQVYTHLLREMELIELGQSIQDQIRERIEASQREFFLREQLRVIRQELGEERDEKGLNIETYERRIAESGMTDDARERASEQLDRLQVLMPDAAEYNTIRTYLDWLVDLPWANTTEDNLDLDNAQRILERDHQGLADVKERIIEFLAVKQLNPKTQGQIICFLGPPGVGKTSLGRSIADALGREFFRFPLGGMRDEAEIKGHRRTYVGAMPGKIIQGLKRVGSRNPVFVLDEIDKLGSDWRGDPSAAMLEVLDPAQNKDFLDHYLDTEFDLSEVMFIATANSLATIPGPLRDRMEVIRIAGYIDDEKLLIARRHLVPRQRKRHGLSAKQLKISDGALRHIIRSYTREAGVRNLDRVVAKVCRKAATAVARDGAEHVKVGVASLPDLLGPPAIIDEVIRRGRAPGVAVGLAWTQFGGDVLFVETTRMPGRGQLKLTGALGDVMSESVQIAFSFVRANVARLRLDEGDFDQRQFHVHFPDGATPKDGPSAGITITTSLLSLLRNAAVPSRLAMTGEITLHGDVLPVGGIKEKVIAARRAGARRVVMPERNRQDLGEVPEHIKAEIEFLFASKWSDVDKYVFADWWAAKKK